MRRGNLHRADLFARSPAARYHYTHGVNLRAVVAFVVGFALPLPGFVASFGHDISAAATHMYELGWVLSFLVGGLAYYVACAVFRVPGDDGADSFEARVAEERDAVLEGLPVGEAEEVGGWKGEYEKGSRADSREV